MNCPRDEHELEGRSIHGVEARICPDCGGLFLARGELNRISDETAGDIEFSTVDLESFQHEDTFPAASCPLDARLMKKVEFLIETNIILDYCDECRGFWLDGAELRRINDSIANLNEAEREIPDPAMVRLSKFLWSLPVPR